MVRIIFLLTAIVGIACASEGGEVDLLWRTINFAIFAALVYWLFAGMAKSFFGDRIKSIVQAFERAQDKAKEARLARNNAALALDEAKATAESILALGKEEANIIAERIRTKCDEEIKVLNKLKDEAKIVAENKMIRSVVSQTIGEILSADDFLSDQEKIVEQLIRRVA
ncbi:hypothetical protein AGMMS49521_1060 [Campylobacterota bacterium]|nr:hypothetical protein AGMMS49521_1060 [Campylobacterota bacterium]